MAKPLLGLNHYTHNGHLVRIIIDDRGKTWVVAMDVLRALGNSEATNSDVARMLGRISEVHRRVQKIPTSTGDQEMITFNTTGFFLITNSMNKHAKAVMQDWLENEVLPLIWKTFPEVPRISEPLAEEELAQFLRERGQTTAPPVEPQTYCPSTPNHAAPGAGDRRLHRVPSLLPQQHVQWRTT